MISTLNGAGFKRLEAVLAHCLKILSTMYQEILRGSIELYVSLYPLTRASTR